MPTALIRAYFEKGAIVEAHAQGSGAWCKGKVAKNNHDGTWTMPEWLALDKELI